MNEQCLRKFAQFVLKSGVNLQSGQNLMITADPYHWDFIALVAEEAYKLGARLVDVNAFHDKLTKVRLDHSNEQFLEYVSAGKKAQLDAQVDEDWCLLVFHGKADPDILVTVDKKRFSTVNAAMSRAGNRLRKACMSNQLAWCVAALPTPNWAARVLDCKPSKEAELKLWELLVPIYRLDQNDPSAAWQAHIEVLEKRAGWLNQQPFTRIRLTSNEGTELEVGLIDKASWNGGAANTTCNVRFSPNIPTEEIFTTPHYRQVKGIAYCTRPVLVLGTQVMGAWFRFENGKVIEYGANKGKGALDSYFTIDEGANYLGELALVGCDSPIFQSGKIFELILFDENASCHIALGSGFEDLIEDNSDMSDDELKALGCNNSLVHTDFMIGSETTRAVGIDVEGNETLIMENGLFVI